LTDFKFKIWWETQGKLLFWFGIKKILKPVEGFEPSTSSHLGGFNTLDGSALPGWAIQALQTSMVGNW
jgi:hypothetical protein